MECVKPGPSEKLSSIGLALLKFVSSHRGLTSVALPWSLGDIYGANSPFAVQTSSMSTHADNMLPEHLLAIRSAKMKNLKNLWISMCLPRFVKP
jgi:hypothetical protein